MRHQAHIAHHAKGRLRVRVPSAKGNPKALEHIRQSLLHLPGVRDVVCDQRGGAAAGGGRLLGRPRLIGGNLQ